MTNELISPPLEPRFLQPDGWQWSEFSRKNGRQLRFGYALPKNPKAVIVMLPGLSEFCEKHFETAHWALEHNFGIFILDWFGQGKSGRYLDNPHKRHSTGFNSDVLDLKFWIEKHVQPITKDVPLVMLALSMGGNIGLHYLAKNQEKFYAAAFLCPMFGIKTMRAIPMASQISQVMKKFAAESYVPGGGNWKEIMHPPPPLSFLSKDPDRNPIHNAWSLAEPELQIGGVTFGWVYEAHKSCQKIAKLDLENIQTPVLITCVQHEILVDNKAVRGVALRLPKAKLVMLHDSYHEPLMERDFIRNRFLEDFLRFIEEGLKEAT